MNADGKLFKIEVVGIFETRARSFEEANAQLERLLDSEQPIVLKSAATAPLTVGDDGVPYPQMRAIVGAFTRLQIERLREQGHDSDRVLDLLAEDDYTQGV